MLELKVLSIVYLVALCHGGVSVAAEAEHNEVLTFINFSDRPIDISWVSPEDQTRHPTMTAKPYQTYTTNTYVGHVFAYEWLDGTDFLYQVSPPNKNNHNNASIHAVHILGDNRQRWEDGRRDLTTNKKEATTAAATEAAGHEQARHVVCGTTKGDIRIVVQPFWSPRGAARFLELLDRNVRYFDGCALNRNVLNFLVQFGIGANYEQRSHYRSETIVDDPQWEPPIPFQAGYLSYAGSGKNSRSTEMFIARPDTAPSQLQYFGTNAWETPFGYVEEESVPVVSAWYSYGDMAPDYGNGPNPQKIYKKDGYDTYLKNEFPKMDYITGCVIIPNDYDYDKKEENGKQPSYEELAARIFVDEDEEEL